MAFRFYTAAPSVAAMSAVAVANYRTEHHMTVEGRGADAIKPLRTFAESGMDPVCPRRARAGARAWHRLMCANSTARSRTT